VILVVEDDDSVRGLTVAMLRSLGYATLEAEDGRSAMSLIESAGQIDLLFTDVVLPGGMSGRDIAAWALETNPDLPVLYTSGYTRDEMVRRGRLARHVRLLQNPFTKGDLAYHVSEVMEVP